LSVQLSQAPHNPEVEQLLASAFSFVLIDSAAGSNLAEAGFFHLIYHKKLVIPTGGAAVFAVPERRNPSETSDFRIIRAIGT